MKLVEKKCPNCGGSLKFNYEDKETTCEFCGRSFEIERDDNIADDNDELLNANNYKLTEEQKKAATAIFGAFAAFQIIPVIIFAVFFIGIVGFGVYKSGVIGNSCKDCITEFSQIDDDFINDMHDNTVKKLKERATFTNHKDFVKEIKNVGMYLEISKKTFNTFYDNAVIDVYLVIYKDGKECYGAVRYEDLKKVDDKISVNFDGELLFPTKMGSNAIYYGYESLKDLYNNEIRSNLEKYEIIVSGEVYNG
jgi:hypothetical protein